ncbi:MAG: 6-bladed beta-propeller [Gammaproteobacteria bacterium]|nr:6-bladed beta-propeller [Gammaproteobacteria bacterium]
MFHLPHKIKKTICHFTLLSGVALALAGCASDDIRGPKKELIFPSPPAKARLTYELTLRSSFDVKEVTAADKLRQFATGSMGTATALGKPYGIAVRKGRVYVTDTVKRAVLMFDVPGRNFKMFGTKGPGTLRKPIGIAVSSQDEIFVADNTGKRIVIFNTDGEFLRAFGDRTILRRPSGVAVSPDGNTAYVIDTGGIDTQEHHLYVFDAKTGELKQTIGTRGTQEGDFNLPLQVTTDAEGTIYVTDTGNFRVQAFNPDGSLKFAFGNVGRKSGNFSRPKGIATDSKGNIYVVDSAFGNFQIFDNKARLLMYIGQRGRQGGPANYLLPSGIAIDEDDRVYVADQFFRKVDVFRPSSLTAEQGYLGGEHLAPPKD